MLEKNRLQSLAPPVEWMPGTAGWVTAGNFPSILTSLRRAVRRQRPGQQLVIALDSASQHLSDSVITHAARLGLHLLFIPARMTYLLQPLDAHVFGTLKRTLRRQQLAARVANPAGSLLPGQWIDILASCVQDVLVKRSWAHAFSGNGLTGEPSAARVAVLEPVGCILPRPDPCGSGRDAPRIENPQPRAARFCLQQRRCPLQISVPSARAVRSAARR